MRADQLLTVRGLAPTRSAAQRLIAGGAVQWQGAQGWHTVAKAGEVLPDQAELRLTDDAELRWASRGGLKLEGALARTGLSVADCDCLDVGQSTGGFTDVLLARGAARVTGIDVGHGQLHPRLAADARVTALEGVHVRTLSQALGVQQFARIVGDLSFISMLGALPHLAPHLAPGGQVLLLIKPQFELGPGAVGKGGIVRDAAAVAALAGRASEAAQTLGWQVRDVFDSPITGGDGNRELFLWAQR